MAAEMSRTARQEKSSRRRRLLPHPSRESVQIGGENYQIQKCLSVKRQNYTIQYTMPGGFRVVKSQEPDSTYRETVLPYP